MNSQMNRIILLSLPLVVASKDVSRLSFAASMKYHIDNGLLEPQLFCSGDLPTLIHTADPTWDASDTSVFDYRSFYNRRQIVLRQDELEGVSFERLTGEPHFRILKAVAMLHSEGWNTTHEIPSHETETSTTITNGFTLLWTKPPSNRMDLKCEDEIAIHPNGNLIVIANWFPGNFGHFLHDTLPIVFWIYNFGMGERDRLGLVDSWLHRTLIKWLHPELSEKVIWLQVNHVSCVKHGSLVSVQSAKANANGRLIRKKEPTTV